MQLLLRTSAKAAPRISASEWQGKALVEDITGTGKSLEMHLGSTSSHLATPLADSVWGVVVAEGPADQSLLLCVIV